MLKQYPRQVKIVFKQFPLRSHTYATKAAQASMAADAQGKFWGFHDLLFRNYNNLNDQKIKEISTILGLDFKQLQHEMNAPHIMAQINKDVRNGKAAGVRGTPTVFVNGRLLKDKSLKGFKQSIDRALMRLKR